MAQVPTLRTQILPSKSILTLKSIMLRIGAILLLADLAFLVSPGWPIFFTVFGQVTILAAFVTTIWRHDSAHGGER